jgi:hypothetical protein
LLLHFANASAQLLSLICDLLHLHLKSAGFSVPLMNVFFGLRYPDLAHFIFLLKVYYQFVLPFDYVSVLFYFLSCVLEPLFEIVDFLGLNLMQEFQLLIQ